MRKLFLVPAILLAMPLFSGCEPLAEGVSKAVFIEFDQSLNFKQYVLDGIISIPPTVASGNLEVSKITARTFEQDGETMIGVWLVYQVCAIRNDWPKAQTFAYDVNKFYVDFNDKRHYYKPLMPYTYQSE